MTETIEKLKDEERTLRKKARRGRPTIGKIRGIPTYTTLEPQHKEALERLAAMDDRSLSNYLRAVLIKHIEEHASELVPIDTGSLIGSGL